MNDGEDRRHTDSVRVQEKLVRLEERVREVRDDVKEVIAKMDGPPFERSLRGRLHKLETDRVAAELAKQVLATAEEARALSSDRVFTHRQILVGLAFAGVVTLCSLTTLVLVFIHQIPR